MGYEIEKTEEFEDWIVNLRDKLFRARIFSHISRMEKGNFGDSKPVGEGISELRLFFGPGFRVYYFIKDCRVILLLNGGDKSTQDKDIIRAKKLLNEVE